MKRTFVRGFLSTAFVFFVPISLIFASATTPTNVLPSECPVSNNIQVSLANKGTEQIITGKDITISGSLVNKNSYPIPDVSMSYRLVKLAKNYASSYDAVTDTVQWGTPIFGSYIGANSKSNFSATIHTPLGLIPGPYFVEIFLDGSSQFAVGGAEYSGVPAAVYPLTISGGQNQTSFFDIPSLKVNSVAPSQHATLAPYEASMATTSIVSMSSISGTHTATTSINIINTYSTSSTATISWSLFKGDFTDNTKNLVTTKTDSVTLLPGKKTLVSFTYSNIVDARYTLVGILNDNDGNKDSIFSVRIYRFDVNEPFAQSLHLDSFPTTSGNFVSGCLLRNTFATTTASLSLTDSSGAIMWSSDLSLDTSSPFVGFHLPLTLASNKSQSLNLSLKTFDASGNIISSSSVSYVCNPTNCPAQSLFTNILFYVIVILIILILIVAIIYLKKRKINVV